MPKAKLEFDLPTEQVEFELAIKAVDWKYVLYDFDQWLRCEIKYNDVSNDYQTIRNKLYEFLEDRNLNFDE